MRVRDGLEIVETSLRVAWFYFLVRPFLVGLIKTGWKSLEDIYIGLLSSLTSAMLTSSSPPD